MNVGLYSAVAGMEMGQDYQDIVTENLANESTPGYRQIIPVFSTDTQAAANSAQETSSGNPAALHMMRVIDFSPGPLEPSGSPYHLAIQGQSFFAIKEADGTTSYTRNGEFTLSPEGELVTTDGAAVQGTGGSTIQIDTSKSSDITIGADGTVSNNIAGITSQVGQLDFAHFDHPNSSLQLGAYGRFTALQGSTVQDGLAEGDRVEEGFLEQSNSNPVQQMAHMIEAVRIYEANQKLIQASDSNNSQLVSSLGGRPQS